MAQNPGEHEEKGQRIVEYRGGSGRQAVPITEPCSPRPMIGKTGYALTKHYLPLAGLERGKSVSVGNVIRCRIDGKNDLPKDEKLLKAIIDHCQRAHFKIPEGTKLILANGAPAAWAMTGVVRPSSEDTEATDGESRNTVSEWRGWLLPYNPPVRGRELSSSIYTPVIGHDLPVLVTLHLASLWRRPTMKVPTMADFSKVQRILKGKWPQPLPEVLTDSHPRMWVNGIAFDTEYHVETRQPYRYNIATPQGEVFVIEYSHHQPEIVPREPLHLIGQNFCTSEDLPIAKKLGVTLGRVDDTMLEDAVLWPGWPHGLDYLGSLHARTNRWKHLAHVNPLVYAGADALGTLDVHRVLHRDLDRDPRFRHTYEEYVRPQIAVIQKARARGVLVDVERAKVRAAQLETELEKLSLQAAVEVGWPIQLSSNPQVAWWLYSMGKVRSTARERR